jgi:hypothetical protein
MFRAETRRSTLKRIPNPSGGEKSALRDMRLTAEPVRCNAYIKLQGHVNPLNMLEHAPGFFREKFFGRFSGGVSLLGARRFPKGYLSFLNSCILMPCFFSRS